MIDGTLLEHKVTKFQEFNLFQSKTFGKFFTLDG
jgi:hypothetical protein